MRGSAFPPAVVAIPAHDEAERIGACLAALAMQRDGRGAPMPEGSFSVLVLANNCRDATAGLARAFAAVAPFPLHVVECVLPPAEAHAGGARRRAMDAAADLLPPGRGGVILTTDADSRAQSCWVSATLAAFAAGVDAVAGYIDADPSEYLALGAGFLGRGRLEDRYLSRVAELYAALDPRRHDPWPNHRVHSGAGIAVTLAAYRAIGGLPVRPLGEDSALAGTLDDAGFLIRHSMEAAVTTSCRFDSRAPGGAGDTMRARHEDLEAPCDGDLERADRLFHRARTRGLLRRLHAAGRLGESLGWRRRLGLDRDAAAALVLAGADLPFSHLWRRAEAESPALRLGEPLRPSALPAEIDAIERLLRRLERLGVTADTAAARFSPIEVERGGAAIAFSPLSPPRTTGPIGIAALAETPTSAIAVPRRR
ncbi:glycosyltransferase [Lichenibacterium dinghuense]|uniref:glycosyltransferase n=1 Tax=Lichenibacterium dinghuense TaxID=2895977 RepID=UPI001F255EFD|nr:glycosyltransferase [Lichenibacterium sp. 6Y81]